MTKDLENQIRQCVARPSAEPDRAAFEQTLWLAKKELQIRSNRQRIHFPAFLLMQIKYTGTRIWLVQAVLLALSVSGLWTIYGDPYFYAPRHVAILLCAAAMLVFLTAIPFIHRSYRYRMAEMEAATTFSSIHLLWARLIITGTGDAAIIAAIIKITVFRTDFGISSAFLYLIVPLLAACFAALYLSRHVKTAHFPYYSGGICLFMLGMILVLNRWYPQCFEQTFSIKWCIICTALFLLCAYQLRHLAWTYADVYN